MYKTHIIFILCSPSERRGFSSLIIWFVFIVFFGASLRLLLLLTGKQVELWQKHNLRCCFHQIVISRYRLWVFEAYFPGWFCSSSSLLKVTPSNDLFKIPIISVYYLVCLLDIKCLYDYKKSLLLKDTTNVFSVSSLYLYPLDDFYQFFYFFSVSWEIKLFYFWTLIGF